MRDGLKTLVSTFAYGVSCRRASALRVCAILPPSSASIRPARMALLFFTVQGFLGCRIGELCGLKTSQLQAGRVVFSAEATKGRKERKCETAVSDEVLNAVAGRCGRTQRERRDPQKLPRRSSEVRGF
jgi:integrase